MAFGNSNFSSSNETSLYFHVCFVLASLIPNSEIGKASERHDVFI